MKEYVFYSLTPYNIVFDERNNIYFISLMNERILFISLITYNIVFDE
jgi:hypothetical protein